MNSVITRCFPILAAVLLLIQPHLHAEQAAPLEWKSPVTWQPDLRAVRSGLYIQPQEAAKKQSVPITVKEPADVDRQGWPVRGGIPLFRGELSDPAHVRLLDAQGKPVPVQAYATAFWPEKSIRFLCLDFVTDLKANEEKSFTLEYGSDVPAIADKSMIRAEQANGCEILGAAGSYAFQTGSSFLTVTLAEGKRTVGPVTGELRVAKDEKGTGVTPIGLTVDSVAIVERGPVQTTVHVLGHYGEQKTAFKNWIVTRKWRGGMNAGQEWRYPISMFFRIYKDTKQVYLEHTFGYNGDDAQDFVQSYGLKFPTGLKDGAFSYGPDATQVAKAPLGVRLNQFGHSTWTLSGKAQAEGKRFGGWGAISSPGASVFAAIREGWQNWPVAIRAEENGDLVYEFLGEKPDSGLDLRWRKDGKFNKSHSMYNGEALGSYYANTDAEGRAAGLRKIHELVLNFSADDASASQVARAHQKPLLPWPGQQRFAETKALGHIVVYTDAKYDYIKEYYRVFLSLMPVVHEANGLYGFVDWGDVPMVESVKNGKFNTMMDGGTGWSNGERGLVSYFYQYAAGGDRSLFDLGRAMVHHTIGMDTEHEGGDYPHGGYMRHEQVHWREWDPEECRQGGYRGWHVYHWMTGDPEVRRLALSAGIDACSNRRNMDVSAESEKAFVRLGGNLASNILLAHMCWITTGDWRYARAHHGISQATCRYSEAGQRIRWGLELIVGKNGDAEDMDKYPDGTPDAQVGYWYTYGGDDMLLEWASLTGDATALNALLHEANRAFVDLPTFGLYHQPEALLLAVAFIDPQHPELRKALERRLAMSVGSHFKAKKAPSQFASAEEWASLKVNVYGKNGFSILGPPGQELLHLLFAFERIDSKPQLSFPMPRLNLPKVIHARGPKEDAVLEVDGAKAITKPDEIKQYTWLVNGKEAAATAQASLKLPVGQARIALQIVDSNGIQNRAQQTVFALPFNQWSFHFGGGPESFLPGHKVYNEELGYGWSKSHDANAYSQNTSLSDPSNARGCQYLMLWQPVDFKVKVPPGKYTLEMGASVTKTEAKYCAPISVGGVVVDVSNKTDKGYRWDYKGDVEPDAQGFITVTFSKTDRYSLISYLIVTKK